MIQNIKVSVDLLSFSAREFITRALLASKADLTEILRILTNEGVGTADGFNVNLSFLDIPRDARVFHTIEVTPYPHDARSEVFMADFKLGSNSLHTNRYRHQLIVHSRYLRKVLKLHCIILFESKKVI